MRPGRQRFTVHWSTLPGAHHDEQSLLAAERFAATQARHLSPEAQWAITDSAVHGATVVTSKAFGGMAFFARSDA
jgi:hypothetical protein